MVTSTGVLIVTVPSHYVPGNTVYNPAAAAAERALSAQ